MPLPTPSDLHVNGLLTNVSVAWTQNADNYVADKVFPRVPVAKQSDLFAVYPAADFLRDDAEKRGPGTESAGGGYRVSQDNYFADVWAFHKDVDDQTRANADSPFDPDRDATQYVTQVMLTRREVDWATSFFSTGVWDTNRVGGTNFVQWSDIASTPLEDIEDESRAIGDITGFEPNTLVIGRQVWQHLKNHPDIVDRIKHTSDRVVTTDLVARLMGLDRILVGRAIRNTAQEGLTASYSRILGRHALLAYSAPSPGQFQPSAGYTFVWSGLIGSRSGQRIKRFRIEERASDRIEIEAAWASKKVSGTLGTFLKNVVST